MMEFLTTLLFPSRYIPHGHCYLWQHDLVWLNLLSDAGIVIAYYTMPLLLLYFTSKRRDIPFRGIFWLFGAFIVSCGTTHLVSIWTLWYHAYWLAGWVKAVTAIISLATVITLISLIPKILTLPSPNQLEHTNQELAWQIVERERAEAEVRHFNIKLQQALDAEERLKRITDRVRDSLDESQILQAAVQELALGVGARNCNASTYNLEAGTSTICYEYTTADFLLKGRVAQISEFPEVYDQLLAGEWVQFCSLRPAPERGQVALLAHPIVSDREVLGDLWLVNDQDYIYSDFDLRLTQQVANQCAIAIRQARLYHAAQSQVQELERLNLLKDDFLSTVSHELRTPMANIKMATHMLQLSLTKHNAKLLEAAPNTVTVVEDALLPPQVNHYIQILQDECQREITLVNDLLDLSRLEAGSEPTMLTPIDLEALITQIAEPYKEQAAGQSQHLQLDLPELPLIYTDLLSVERIVGELLNNACKYTPAGKLIRVSAELVDCTIAISVMNQGVEISPAERDRIFDKFYRIPNNDPWKHGGTGLGLALVKRLAEHLEGSISVLSEFGATTFTICLPVSIVAAQAQPCLSYPN